MRKLKLFFACLLMTVLSIGQVWAADPSVRSTFSTSSTITDNKVTENGVTWTLDATGAVGSPTITTATASSTQGLKFGSSGSNYYASVKFSTNYFKDYNVKSVTIYEKNNGSKIGTLTVKQGSITIGTASHSAKTSDWATLTASGTTGAGGTLEVTYEVAQASYFNYIEVVYEEGGNTCSSEITITKADDPANGTFTLDESGKVCIDEGNATINVTATPADHYHLASVTSTVGTVGTISNNTCAITNIGANTTISATFAEDDKVKVTWNVNGDETLKTDVYVGEKPVFPAKPDACDATSTTFIGWATEPWSGKLADLAGKTVYTSASAMPDVDAAVTYYAVFAKAGGTASNLFSWAGGTKAELEAAEGVAALNADNSDYAEANAPYRVKWNGTGKYIIISVASQPGQVSAGFKMIGGGTTSTITVQEADDAEGPFTDVENLAISGSSNDVVNIESTQAFKSTTRAIKLYYTKGSNVGLGPISIEGAVSYEDYMTTCGCEKLGTPSVTVPAANLTHNSAKLTWAAVDNADKYLVKINGVDQEATSNLYFDATGLTPETQYTYQVKALPAANQDDYCEGDFSEEANFTTDEAPKAHLTLIDIEGTHASSGDYAVGIPFNLPTTAASCSKTFVGWDDDENCATAPTYTKGQSFTFENQTGVTLYAVYATAANINAVFNAESYAGDNNWEDATAYSGFTINGVTFNANGGGNNGKYYVSDKTWRLYNGGSISLSATGNILSVTSNPSLSFTIDGTSASCSFTATTKIKSITVIVEATSDDYSTTCAAPLDAPTFSVPEQVDPFTSELNVELNATEGDIYYNINSADDPTSGSTPYTGAIEINTCGSTTIKAIAISSTSQSPVASATYVLNLPIPSVSAEDPYTEAEAVQVYNSGCYDNEDVWVTGTVKTAQFYSSNTYTITLTNDFQFYYFYESFDGENLVPFSSDYIEAGDVLVAKGKLGKHSSTYQIANGYLVSRTPATKEPIVSDIDNPITVAAALNYIEQAATYELTNVYVEGVASSDPNNVGTFNIHDAGVENSLQIYKGVLSDALITAGVEVEENDTIIAFGELTSFYSTKEMAEGGQIVVVKKYVAPDVDVESVSVDDATVKAGKTVQLTATVLPDNASNKNVTWSVTSGAAYADVDATGLVTGKAEGEAVIRATSVADGTIYGECTVTVTPGTPANTDIITAEEIGVGTSYEDWSGKNGFGTSSVYAGNSMTATAPNAGAIQLRYHATDENKQAGIVLTSSNGLYLKNLAVTVKSGSNVLNVYAKNTAYTSRLDLYSDDEDVCGKLIGTVSTTGDLHLEDGISYNDNYQYIGMRSAGGALYLEDITITWGEEYVAPAADYTRNVTNGNYGTICLPQAGTISGATLFEIADYDGSMIYVDEILSGEMEAGRPYIFQATSEQLNVTYTSSAVEETAGHANGLYGFYNLENENAQFDIEENAGNYILYSNAYWLVKGRAAYIANYRAYIKLSQINNTGAQAPGRRRVAMAVNGEQVVTGIGELNASETPVKMIIDGQLFIIRGEKMYNANGQLVK